MSWSEKYKKSIDCDNPKGFSQRAHCQGRNKKMQEENKSGDEGLHDWFNKSKSTDGKSGWVQLGGKWSGKPCARQPGQTSTPKCGSSKMKKDLSAKEEEAARRRKNRQDPNQPEKTGGAKPTNVRTEEMDLQEVKDKPGKGSGKKDACYNKVKSRYSVWPSAYASGALVKCRKVGSSNWGTKSEDCWDGYKQEGMKKKGKKLVPNCVPVKEEKSMIRYCPRCGKDETRSECKYGVNYWDMFSLPPALTTNQLKFDIAQVHPTNEEKDHEHSMARSEISKIISAAKRLRGKVKGEGNLPAWVQSKITRAADYIDTAADYVDSGEMHEENIQEALPAVGMLLGRLLGGAAGRAVAPAVTARIAGPAAQGSLRALVGQKAGEMAGAATQQHIQKRIEDKFKKKEPVEQGVLEGISFEIGHTPADTRRALRNAAIENLAKRGATEGERSAAKGKLKGIQLPLANSNDLKTFGQFMQEAIDKSSMKCNSPKAQAHGSGEQGKSHVVKACEGGKEKIIRFGQVGVKGSPKKKGESEAYANRRKRFKARHAKNIAKGKMSAAYWADKVKW